MDIGKSLLRMATRQMVQISFLRNCSDHCLVAERLAASNEVDTRSFGTAAMAVVLSIDAMVSHSW